MKTDPSQTWGPGDKAQILDRSLLSMLTGDSRQAFLGLGTLELLARKRTIAAQGEPPRSFLVIGSGRVKLERWRRGHLLSLGHRGPGHVVGETALLDGALTNEAATVVDDVRALVIPVDALRRRLAQDPALRRAMTAAIVELQGEVERRLTALLLFSVEARLATFLLEARRRWGTPHPQGEILTTPFTHADMAMFIGSTRETVTLVLGKLKREQILDFDRRRVIIRDRERLAERASSPSE